MAKTKKQTLKKPMKQLKKNSRRASWPVGVTKQHRINTRKQVAHAPGSQLSLSLVQHVLHIRFDHQYAP